MGAASTEQGSLPVLFFDIDNCLYSRSAKVHDLMVELIDDYFVKHLNLPPDEAVRLQTEYYTNYGLAIEGLVRHHKIDPLDYNAKVDDALPLENVIKPNPELRSLLQNIDRSKVRLWLLTNAYVTHARRVIKLLGIDDLFEGLTYCDYADQPLICKPDVKMYKKAMRQANVTRVEDCFFVGTMVSGAWNDVGGPLLTLRKDDSFTNCVKATELGWTVAHLVEEDLKAPETPASKYQIQHLRELRDVFPQFFKPALR